MTEAPLGDSRASNPLPFADRVDGRIAEIDSRVCLGIDPRPAAHPLTHPDRFDGDPAKTARAVVHYFQAIVSSTKDLVACYKLQSAFFEVLGIPGLIALAQLLADIRSTGVPVILDAKRGDIDSTAQAYAEAYLGEGVFGADALTVNPYLGLDSIEPFLRLAGANGRGVLVLVKTSNPGSGDLQDLPLEGGQRLWERLAERLVAMAGAFAPDGARSPLGAVVGGTYPEELRALRRLMPGALLLIPGYGTQGGTADAIAPAFENGRKAVVSASRSLTYHGPADDFAAKARLATERMRDELNQALD